jgi:hypothetical protein
MTNKIRISPKSQSRWNRDGAPSVRTLVVGTIVETPVPREFSTRMILWFSRLNGRTSQHKEWKIGRVEGWRALPNLPVFHSSIPYKPHKIVL